MAAVMAPVKCIESGRRPGKLGFLRRHDETCIDTSGQQTRLTPRFSYAVPKAGFAIRGAGGRMYTVKG